VEQDQLYSFDREYNHIKIIDLFAKRAKRLIEDKNTMTKKNVNLTTEVNQQKNKLVELTCKRGIRNRTGGSETTPCYLKESPTGASTI
jgi:hypothetical protein